MLENTKVVIVGGSSGIGFSLASYLLAEGSEIIIASRSLEKLAVAKGKLSGFITTQQVDASNEASVKRFFSRLGEFDHLIVTIKPDHLVSDFQDSDTSNVRTAFDAKFWGQYNLVRLCLDTISKQGSIILTSGIASQKSYRGFSGTAAINGAIESFVKSVSAEVSPIRINTVCPGFIERHHSDDERFEAVKKLGGTIPLGRLGTQQEVVSGFMYLLENSYTTGTTLVIDGGELCV